MHDRSTDHTQGNLLGAGTLVGVDIGNSRIKLCRFDRHAELAFAEPAAVCDLAVTHPRGEFEISRLIRWCDENAANGAVWHVASVNRLATHRLIGEVNDWAMRSAIDCRIVQISFVDVPLAIHVEEPSRVGIDRLLAALAADKLRQRDRAAIIVDLGTAITVDLLEADGAFAGGAILPGIAMSARALEEQTDALPRVALDDLDVPPAPIGKSTVRAIESGLYWGAVGAVGELISQMSRGLSGTPEVFVTGGASSHVAELLAANSNHSIRHVPHLVLSGIALVAS